MKKTMLLTTVLTSASWIGASAMATPILSTGTIGSQAYNSGQASSIVPGLGDVAVGSSVFMTNYVGNNEATGGSISVLVDNQTAVSPSNAGNASLNLNEGTTGANSAFDLGAGNMPWYVAFTLPATGAAAGYDITSFQVITGHTNDNRVKQAYDLLVSSDGVQFFSLSDGLPYTLPDPASGGAASGPGFAYDMGGTIGGAAQTTVKPSSGVVLATGVKYFEFVDRTSGNSIYREVALYGGPSAIPEPAALGLLSIGALALIRRRSR